MNVGEFHIVLIIFTCCTQHVFVSGYIRACLFKSATRFRTNEAAFKISDIDFTLCTHYIYGYARVDIDNNRISSMESRTEEGQDGLYTQFNSAKSKHGSIKTLLSVGGADPSSAANFQALSNTDQSLQSFSENVAWFLQKHGFDGLDVDWEYPDTPAMKTKLVKLLQALSTEFGKHSTMLKLLLTATCPGFVTKVKAGFDVVEIRTSVDYVFIKAFNLVYTVMLHATFGSALFRSERKNFFPFLNVNDSINYWNGQGMPYHMMVLGVSPVGRAVKLSNKSLTSPGSPIQADVVNGSIYGIPSGMAYPEVCLKMPNSTKHFDSVQKCPYLVSDFLWVGYENEKSLGEKISFSQELDMAGVFFSSMDEDDFSGKMCQSGRYPLLSYINNKLISTTTVGEQTTDVLTNDTPSESKSDATTESQKTGSFVMYIILYLTGFVLGMDLSSCT